MARSGGKKVRELEGVLHVAALIARPDAVRAAVAARRMTALSRVGAPDTLLTAWRGQRRETACVAVFERAFGKLRLFGTDEFGRHAEFPDGLDDYGIVLTKAAEPRGGK